MIKIWGYGDVGTGDSKYVTGAYTHIEGIDVNDNVVPSDVNRVYRNIYEETYEIFSFLEELASKSATVGVFKGSLTSAFAFDGDTYSDVTTVTLDSTVVHYSRLAPGIAFNNGYIVVNKPAVHIAERQLAEIFSLEVDGSESVDIAYDYAGDSYSAVIVRKNVTGDSTTYTFNNSGAGHKCAVGLLEEIYNDGTFIAEFVAAVGTDLTKITLEPVAAVTDGNTYYWNIQNDGTIVLEASAAAGDSELGLANFTVGVSDNIVGASSVSDNRVFVQNVNDFTNTVNLNVPSSWGDSDTRNLATAPFDQVTNQDITINMLLQRETLDDKVTFGWRGDTISGLTSSEDGGDTYKNEVFYLNKDLIVKYDKNLIDRGDCESDTPPMIFGETSPNGYNEIFAKSGDTFYGDTNSFKFTKDVASGSGSVVSLDDQHTNSTTDMHGLVTGNTYTFSAWIWIPSGGILGSEIKLNLDDYQGSWGESGQAATNDYDQWQYVEVTRTIRSAATGITIYFYMASTAENTEYYYVDAIKLEEKSGWLQLSSLGEYHKNTGDHKDNIIQDRHIDWGTGDSQVSAEDVPIADSSGYYAATDVEMALHEIGDSYGAARVRIGDSGTFYAATDVEGALAELGSTSGAAIIGIGDSGTYFTGTDVEAALREMYEYTRDTDFMPVGTIIMFDANNTSGGGGRSGGWVDNSTLPGWYACIAGNTAAQSCPNLVDTFIMGKVVAGGAATGGSNTVALSEAELAAHTHTINHDHPNKTSTAGTSHNHAISGGAHNHTIEISTSGQVPGATGTRTIIIGTTGWGTNFGSLNSSPGYVDLYTYESWHSVVRAKSDDSHTHTNAAEAAHTHDVDIVSFSGSSGSIGSGTAHENKPAYYSVIFIRKCS